MQLMEAVASRPAAKGYRVSRSASSEFEEKTLETRLLKAE
jgi:hypothetical protein